MTADHDLELTMDEFHALQGIDDAGALGLETSKVAHSSRGLVELGYVTEDDTGCLVLTAAGRRVLLEVRLLNHLAHTERVGQESPGEADVAARLIEHGLVKQVAGFFVLTRAGLNLHLAMHHCGVQPAHIAE